MTNDFHPNAPRQGDQTPPSNVVRIESRAAVLPPHDPSAEEACIAAMLLDEEAYGRVAGVLASSEDFFRETNQWCFEAATALTERREPITLPTLAHELDRAGHLDQLGGEPGLVEIAARHFTAQGVEAHARIVARDAVYRRLISASGQITAMAYEGGPNLDTMLIASRELIEQAGINSVSSPVLPARDVATRYQPGSRETVSTGYKALDHAVRGLALHDLCCIASWSNHGKTALMSSMAVRQSLLGIPVAYCAVEGPHLVLPRMIASISGVHPEFAERFGGWQEGEAESYNAAMELLFSTPLLLPDPDAPRPDTPERAAQWLASAARDGARVCYFDHFDQMTILPRRSETMATAIDRAMQMLVDVATDYDTTIVFGSQVSRADRHADAGKMPTMDMLRGSGSKEQKTQLVIMLLAEQDAEKNQDVPGLNGGNWLYAHIDKAKTYVPNADIVGAHAKPMLYTHAPSSAVFEVGDTPGSAVIGGLL